MSWIERCVHDIVSAYIEEENCRAKDVDIDDAIELCQNINFKLKRTKRKSLEEAVVKALTSIKSKEKNLPQNERPTDNQFDGDDNMITLSEADVNKMNESVKSLWTKPAPEEKDEKDERDKEKQPKKKKRKTASSSPDRRSALPVTLSDLGGIDGVINQILELIAMPLSHPEIYLQLGSEVPRGILLHGPPGCGKTMLANAIANELGVSFISISAPAVVSGMSGESEKKLRDIFEEAKEVAPCLIFIDEIDAITPKRENVQREMERRIVAQLLTCMDDVAMEKTGGKPVMIIGATNRPDAIDPALRRGGRFDHEICMSVPDQESRRKILMTMARKLKLEGNFDYVGLAKMTAGFVGADLNALVSAAGVSAIKRVFKELSTLDANKMEEIDHQSEQMDVDNEVSGNTSGGTSELNGNQENNKSSLISQFLQRHPDPLTPEQLEPLFITFEDFLTAIPKVQPSSKREGFATVPDVTWEDVGAMKPIREELEYAIVEPIRRPEIYKAAGIAAPSGVLLWGPPGCGKTLLAKAVANESRANFISVRGPELLNKYVGESERAVRQVFVRARASVPCVIFFDELDALVPRRDDSQSESSSRVVNTLLTELDGVSDRHGVFVVAATNRPDMIDSAMLRPGRLDKQLFVELPNSQERTEILRTVSRASPLAPNVDLTAIAHDERCRNFSGADLAALVREAAVTALKSTLATATGNNVQQVTINNEHFELAFDKVRPSVSDSERAKYYLMRENLAS